MADVRLFPTTIFLLVVAISCVEAIDYLRAGEQHYESLRGRMVRDGMVASNLWDEANGVPNALSLQESYHGILRPEVLSQAEAQGVPQKCAEALSSAGQALADGHTWPIMMLDAMAKVDSGLFLGNFLWTGSYPECVQQTAYVGGNATNGTLYEFELNYHTALINYKPGNTGILSSSPVGGLWFGLCFPEQCTTDNIMLLTNLAISQVDSLKKFAVYLVVLKTPYDALDTPAIIMTVVLCLLGTVLLICTGYDIIVVRKWIPTSNSLATDKYSLDMNGSASNSVESVATEASTSPLVKTDRVTAASNGEMGRAAMFMIRLSLYTNGVKLLSTQRAKGSLDCLNGIRFLSMAWVILGHAFAFAETYLNNRFEIYSGSVTSKFSFQAIYGGFCAVDTFFTLSACLVSYLALKEMQKKNGPKGINWVMFYIHRFWRLTPPYMLVLGITTVFMKYLGSGPFWDPDTQTSACKDDWWTNILYVNNIVDGKISCVGHAWYLANDMQFYVASPVFIVLLFLWPVAGWIVSIVAIVTSMVVMGVLTYVNQWPATSAEVEISRMMNYGDYFQNGYITPWCRFAPYGIGILLGYLLFKSKLMIRIHWILVALGWVLATAIGLAVVYGTYGQQHTRVPWSDAESALYAGMHRAAWSVAVGWVIFACSTGYGGPVNWILSLPVFIPLSRLTFMAYLIHPYIIYGVYMNMMRTIRGSEFVFSMFFLLFMVMSMGMAFVLSLTLEAPWMGLEKVLLYRPPPPKKSAANHEHPVAVYHVSKE